MFGRPVQVSREGLGRQLAREAPADADLVVPVPDSGVTAAVGYAAESGIPFRFGLIRNHYVGRTFIEPRQSVRDFGVKLKLNPVRTLLEGKRVVLIDDSIVRGTTSRKIVRMIRNAGAKEVHMRVSCPPTVSPCFYGVDTPSKKELIAANKSVEEIREFIGADSLAYLSLEGMKKACADGEKTTYCTACYTGLVSHEMGGCGRNPARNDQPNLSSFTSKKTLSSRPERSAAIAQWRDLLFRASIFALLTGEASGLRFAPIPPAESPADRSIICTSFHPASNPRTPSAIVPLISITSQPPGLSDSRACGIRRSITSSPVAQRKPRCAAHTCGLRVAPGLLPIRQHRADWRQRNRTCRARTPAANRFDGIGLGASS